MRKFTEQIAIFMICLIVMLPIYIGSVYADINSVRVTTKEGLPGMSPRQYDLTFEADVSLPTAVAPEKVKLRNGQLYTNFDTCRASGNSSYLCSINIIKGVNSEVEICPSTNFIVELFDLVPSVAPIDTRSVSVSCDSQPPQVSVSASPQLTNGGIVTINYNINDPVNSATKCSGIDKIEFYTNSLTNAPAVLNVNSSTCSLSSSTTVDSSAYNDGNVTVFIKAYDKLGQSGFSSTSFRVHKGAPQASISSSVTDLSGNPLVYFRPQNVLVDVTVTINDSIGIGSYSLDYSQLTSTAPACSQTRNNVICRWDNLQIYMNSSSVTKTITANAADTAGNSNSVSLPIRVEIVEDKTPPTIVISDITVSTADGTIMEWFKPGLMKMSFSAEATDELSGIKSISGDFSNLDVFSGDIPVCSGSGSSYLCVWNDLIFTMNTPTFSKTIKITAKDNLNNEKSETKTVAASYKADTVAPSISNFKIVRSDNRNISGWLGKQQFSAKISVDVDEKGSGLDYISGYFPNINPSYTSYMPGRCTVTRAPPAMAAATATSPASGIYQPTVRNTTVNVTLPEYKYLCVWDVQVKFNSSGNPFASQFTFNATDKSLNSAGLASSQNFQVDVDGPTVSSLMTNWQYNSINYVGTGSNIFTANVNDAGVGISKSEVYLDLSSLGFGSNIKANNCSNGYCFWYMPGVNSSQEGSHLISINTNTKDDLDNNLLNPFSINVTVEKTSPSVNSVNLTPIAASTQLYMNFIQTGNALYIVADVTEATSLLSATADLSNFISNETSALADSCERQVNSRGESTDHWICIWSTDEIDINAYNKDNIYLNFTDIAGNSFVYPYEIEVFEAMAAGSYNYWSSAVGDSTPSAIDRQIVTFYNPSMWFPISLVSTEGKSGSERWPLEIVVESCSSGSVDANGTSASNYLSSANMNMPELINTNTATPSSLPYNFYLNYVLEQTAPSESSIEIPCTVKIRTLVDNQKISPYEYENVTVTINYYNNPLGTIDSNVQDEIDDVKDSWLVKAEWIGTISKIMEIASMLCNFVNKLYMLSKIVGGISDGLKSNAYTEAAGIVMGNTAGTLGEGAETGWKMYVNKFCKFLNCQLYYGKDWGGGKQGGEAATNFLASWGRFGSKYQKYFNPKDSLILSIVFLCLPGVLYNLQKARAVDCQYVKCLKATAVGMPLQFCVKQRDYGWCSYVYGQIFNLLPFKSLYALMNKIKEILRNPFTAVSVGLKLICKAQCASPSPTCTACLVLQGAELLIDVLCDLGVGADTCEPFWKDLKVDDSACDDI